jgi:hypothetical protein
VNFYIWPREEFASRKTGDNPQSCSARAPALITIGVVTNKRGVARGVWRTHSYLEKLQMFEVYFRFLRSFLRHERSECPPKGEIIADTGNMGISVVPANLFYFSSSVLILRMPSLVC